MNLVCSECEKKVLTYTYLSNRCEICNTSWESKNTPIVKYCDTCSKESNLCKICGTNLDFEFETSKFVNLDKLRENISYIDIITNNQLERLNERPLSKNDLIWILSYLKTLDSSISQIINQLTKEVPNLNDFNHSFIGIKKEDIEYLKKKYK